MIAVCRISLWALIGGKFIAAASLHVLIAVLVRVLIVTIGIFILAPVIILLVVAWRVLLVTFVGRAPVLWALARAALIPVGSTATTTAVVGLAAVRLAEFVN